ncbi:LADA_0F08570g1_1 [Lachancea dasiensis]|uniref:Guanine nucleotide-binding protein subunit gamma n=1 Tax=Lachancea dasiensis TaxID=1072105 RepID=A0A1G4JKT4_9SACH|nr:LADA_0F08570g1_1 [Lachancea dasiensis]
MDDQNVPLKIQYLKLKRIKELNQRLKQELARERITASNACLSIIDYATSHTDYTLPEIWGYPAPGSNPHTMHGSSSNRRAQVRGSGADGICCIIM